MVSTPILNKQYVEQRRGGYWIRDTRISLDSVVYAFIDGASPESIAQNFPLLSLEQVYGAIAFYLANRDPIDAYLEASEAEFQILQASLREKNLTFHQKLQEAKAQKQTKV